jgi:hypothetical protein
MTSAPPTRASALLRTAAALALLVSMLLAWSVALPSDEVRDLGSGKATVMVAGAHRHGGVMTNGAVKALEAAATLATVLVALVDALRPVLRRVPVLRVVACRPAVRWRHVTRRGPPALAV